MKSLDRHHFKGPMSTAENDASSIHLATFNLKDRVMFQGNDLCRDGRQSKCWSDRAETRSDPWGRGGSNNIEKSDLFA